MNKVLYICQKCGENYYEKDAIKVERGLIYKLACPKCKSLDNIGIMPLSLDSDKLAEEEDLDLKFKAGDRVFNKVTRKWVNIIEFDIETGLYIVRYDDGIQGRSLESELCETQPNFNEIKEVVKKKAEVYINSKTELDGLSKSLLYEGFVDGMMTALIELEE